MKIFKIICMAQEIYRTLRYGKYISGHDYVEQNDGTLKCELCGEVSE